MTKWSVTPLKGHIQEISTRKGNFPAEILSVTNSNGFVRSLEVFDKQVYSTDTGNYKLVAYEDLAYNPSRINVGSVALCQLTDGGAVSPMYVVVRCKATLLPEYLYRFLKSHIGAQYIEHHCVGAVRFQLRFSDLERIEIPLPPVPEQQRIVNNLRFVAELNNLRHESDRRAADLPDAEFVHLFGDLEVNPKRWNMKPVRDLLVAPLQNGVSPATEGTEIDDVLTLSAITGNTFDANAIRKANFARVPDDGKKVSENKFLICRGNGNEALVGIGKFASPSVWGCIFPDTMICAQFDQQLFKPGFVEALWRSPFVRRQIRTRIRTTNGAHKINQTGIESIILPVPPLPLQELFGEKLRKLSDLARLQAASHDQLQGLSESILADAYRRVL